MLRQTRSIPWEARKDIRIIFEYLRHWNLHSPQLRPPRSRSTKRRRSRRFVSTDMFQRSSVTSIGTPEKNTRRYTIKRVKFAINCGAIALCVAPNWRAAETVMAAQWTRDIEMFENRDSLKLQTIKIRRFQHDFSQFMMISNRLNIHSAFFTYKILDK